MLFFVMELDRINASSTVREAAALRRHFGGIREAQCWQVADRRRIWKEIGNQVEVVDSCIEVLLSAGLSTKALREAHEKGVDITAAAFVEAST